MLWIGPPGSGKTHRVLGLLESALASGRDVRLVAPTASMAEHLRHQVARRCGLCVSPGRIQTLAGFVETLTPGVRQPSPAGAAVLLGRVLAAPDPEFRAVAACPGFQHKLLETFEEFWAAGIGGEELARLLGSPTAFTRALAAYERLLEQRGLVHRPRRLRLAAAALRQRQLDAIFFDGFPNFTLAELELVCAARDAARMCIVTLPQHGAEESRRILLERGFPETLLDRVYRPRPRPVVVEAPSPEREIEDVARRILADRARTRRPFRDYGLILRNPDNYEPLVAVVFERFGIPFRWTRLRPLAEHPATRYLAGLLQAALEGFDAVRTVELLKLHGSGLACHPELDEFEFQVRERAPGAGILFLLQIAGRFPAVRQWIGRLQDLSLWAAERLPPASWGERAARMAETWFAPPGVTDGVGHTAALDWRALACALDGSRQAAREAADWIGESEIDLAGYLRVLHAVLRDTPLRVPDRRRDVVQVLSVYEARQWELPVVFICGLVERQFPRYHQQNLFFPDGARAALALRGVPLRTTADLDRDEFLLFETAKSCAVEQLYLTYPSHDEDGADTLRSFFLEGFGPPETALPVRVRENAPLYRQAPGFLGDPRSLAILQDRHGCFSPSALEDFIQCPFRFFARHTLGLQGPPSAPEDRIDAALKGTIIHRTIARWAREGGEIGPLFDRVFHETCAQEGISLNFQGEALYLELRADLERFARCERSRIRPAGLAAGPPETEIQYVVESPSGRFRIAGRLDRYECSPDRAAVVIDYKYSTPDRLDALRRQQELGLRLQAPLYLLGLEKERGLHPAGMVFYGLRQSPSRRGWIAGGAVPEDPELESLPPADFREMLERAAARAADSVSRIRGGDVEVKPLDRGICREYCPYRLVCRVTL